MPRFLTLGSFGTELRGWTSIMTILMIMIMIMIIMIMIIMIIMMMIIAIMMITMIAVMIVIVIVVGDLAPHTWDLALSQRQKDGRVAKPTG